MLARPDLPAQALVLKASPGPLPKGFPDLSNGMAAVVTQYMGACYSARQGRPGAVASAFDKLSGVLRLLMDGADARPAADERLLLGSLPPDGKPVFL